MAKCDYCGKNIPLFGGTKRDGKHYHQDCFKIMETKARILKEITGLSQDDFYWYILKKEDLEEQSFALYVAEENQSFTPDWIAFVRQAHKAQKEEKGTSLCKEAWAAQDKKDYRLSRQKFKEAAELGHPDGMYNYARLSFKFDDYREGKIWLKKAIESGTYDDEHTRQLLAFVEDGGTLNIVD